MSIATGQARRTPLRRMLDQAGAEWHALADTEIAYRVDARPAGNLILADLSPLPRIGFKGRGTIAAMKARGIALDATPNAAFRQPDGSTCLVLGPGEVLLLASLSGEGGALDRLVADWSIEADEHTYPLLRRDSHAWFAVAGSDAPGMFAKVCGVDLRTGKFPDLAIAQTSVARMSAIIARVDGGGVPLYHVLADSAAALYFCSSLMDAAQEFQGRLAGLKTLQDLARA